MAVPMQVTLFGGGRAGHGTSPCRPGGTERASLTSYLQLTDDKVGSVRATSDNPEGNPLESRISTVRVSH